MTPQQLRKLGKQLGAGWQSKLARILPCNPRTVRRWLKEGGISPLVAERIKQVVKENKNAE